MKLIKYIFIPLLVLSILSNIIVLYLFYAQKNKTKSNQKQFAQIKFDKKNGVKIAFIQIDKIEREILLTKKIKKEIESFIKLNANKLGFLLKNYQEKNKLLEKNSHKLTPNQIQTIKEELMNMKNVYDEIKNSQEQDLKEFEFNKIKEIRRQIGVFLNRFCIENSIDMVLNNEEYLLYYKNPAIDITQEVITNLNKSYLTNKP